MAHQATGRRDCAASVTALLIAVVCKSFATTLISPPNIFAYFIRRAGTALPAHSNISDLICRNANGGEIQKPNKINVLTL